LRSFKKRISTKFTIEIILQEKTFCLLLFSPSPYYKAFYFIFLQQFVSVRFRIFFFLIPCKYQSEKYKNKPKAKTNFLQLLISYVFQKGTFYYFYFSQNYFLLKHIINHGKLSLQ